MLYYCSALQSNKLAEKKGGERRIVPANIATLFTGHGSRPAHWNGHGREKISRRPQNLSIDRPIFSPTSIASLICRILTLSLNGIVVDKMTWRTLSQLGSASCKIVSTAVDWHCSVWRSLSRTSIRSVRSVRATSKERVPHVKGATRP